MNIHEAEEIVRNKSVIAKDPSQWAGYLRAREVLIETMLSELDPTPITKDWLRANGWVQIDKKWCKNSSSLRISDYHEAWLFANPQSNWTVTHAAIKALGELRTLLRLMGEMK